MARYKDVEGYRKLFDEEYKKTRKLISEGETHLDNLAEGFSEASRVIDRMPTADVVPKSEVEELSDKYEDLKLKYADLQKDHDELLAWGGHIKSAERAEIGKAVAREIFGEIEYNFAEIRKIEYDNPPVGVMFNTLDYLKKKRTEEKG